MVSSNSQINIRLYCGIGETAWNKTPVRPGRYACIAPVYGSTQRSRKENRVSVPQDCLIIQDSGAFSDGPDNRLNVEQALARQILHAVKYNYTEQVTHVASYDLLIDERWENGRRFKKRWTETSAERAVDITVENARWLSDNRRSIPYTSQLILSGQGVTPQQYKTCTERIMPYMQPGDMFGLGGFCIVGKMRRRMMPVFSETIQQVLPILNEAKVKRVHIWGVLLAEALAQLGYWCNKYNIQLSTDSVGPSVKPCLGSWGYADWRNRAYKRVPPEQRGDERAKHVKAVSDWLSTFSVDKYINPMYSEYCTASK